MEMKKTLALLSFSLLGSATMASAQSAWDFSGTFYLWGAETGTTISTPDRTIDSTLSFSDALDNLDFAFMGTLEARNNDLSLIGDVARTKLSFGEETPGTNFDGINAKIKTTVVNLYALYRVYETPQMSIDAGAGARWFETDSALTLRSGDLAGGTNTASDNWIDPFIAARAQFQLSEKWTAAVFLDYGGFRSNSTSWQAVVSAQYAINDQWSLTGGYRYLDISHDTGPKSFDFTQSGPVFGATYRF